jgi:hypothetical protein
MKPNIGQKVIYVDHTGNQHNAIIEHVWTEQCVNLKLDDDSHPTSIMKADYFPKASEGEHTHYLTGNYWIEKPKFEGPKPSVGRIVHYVLKDHYGELQHRPAIIVRNWSDGLSDENNPFSDMIQLQVFTDGTNDGTQYATGVYWATSVHQDEEEKIVGTWHWPERE